MIIKLLVALKWYICTSGTNYSCISTAPSNPSEIYVSHYNLAGLVSFHFLQYLYLCFSHQYLNCILDILFIHHLLEWALNYCLDGAGRQIIDSPVSLQDKLHSILMNHLRLLCQFNYLQGWFHHLNLKFSASKVS